MEGGDPIGLPGLARRRFASGDVSARKRSDSAAAASRRASAKLKNASPGTLRECGATIPRRMQLEAERVWHDPAAVARLGVVHALEQCEELLARGAPGIRFYTPNRSPATRLVLSALRGVHPLAAEEAGSSPQP